MVNARGGMVSSPERFDMAVRRASQCWKMRSNSVARCSGTLSRSISFSPQTCSPFPSKAAQLANQVFKDFFLSHHEFAVFGSLRAMLFDELVSERLLQQIQ